MSDYVLGYTIDITLIILLILLLVSFIVLLKTKVLLKYKNNTKNINTTDDVLSAPIISNFPHIWIGYYFAMAFILLEILEIRISDDGFHYVIFYVIGLSGFAYWLFCGQRIHKILREVSKNQYPITPGSFVVGHCIPFYGIYWIFKWPIELSKFIKNQGNIKIIYGWLLGLFLLVSIILGRIDGGLGLICLFLIITYIAKKVNKYVAYIMST